MARKRAAISNTRSYTGPGKGNRRTGVVKGRSGRVRQLPWRDDPAIRKRIEQVALLHHRDGLTRFQCALKLKVSEGTVEEDLGRWRALQREQDEATAQDILALFEELYRQGQEKLAKLRAKDAARSYADIFSTLHQNVLHRAKVRGLLIEKQQHDIRIHTIRDLVSELDKPLLPEGKDSE
jgi:hypothetical protein